ncbi:hypothetical protein A6U95_24965 [Serratia sp. 14-2641]|nr:hypothetical protein A6U95_24965 [Serratia sp. 14-2641]
MLAKSFETVLQQYLDGQEDCGSISPGDRDLNGDVVTGMSEQEPGATPKKRSETALPLTPRQGFGGVQRAQATARQSGSLRSRRHASDALDVRYQTLPAGLKPALAGFSGDWRADLSAQRAECGSTSRPERAVSRRDPKGGLFRF